MRVLDKTRSDPTSARCRPPQTDHKLPSPYPPNLQKPLRRLGTDFFAGFVLCPLSFHHGLRARAQREACGATTTCLRRAQAAHTATTGSKAPPFRRCPTSPAVVPAEVVVDAVALMPAEGLPRTERRTSAGLRPPSTSSCSGATTMRIRSSIAGSM